MKGLDVAIDTLEDEPPPLAGAPASRRFWPASPAASAGCSASARSPIELPVTTTLMLRAIAEIARHQGEDLSTLEARLACLEVFAYGAKRTDETYRRRLLRRARADQQISPPTSRRCSLERGAIDASAPVVASLVTEIVVALRHRGVRQGRGRRGADHRRASAAPPSMSSSWITSSGSRRAISPCAGWSAPMAAPMFASIMPTLAAHARLPSIAG